MDDSYRQCVLKIIKNIWNSKNILSGVYIYDGPIFDEHKFNSTTVTTCYLLQQMNQLLRRVWFLCKRHAHVTYMSVYDFHNNKYIL
jgi:hypothetical protein